MHDRSRLRIQRGRSFSTSSRLTSLFITALLALACGSSESDLVGPGGSPAGIGPDGGTLSFLGDTVILVFPAGAVAQPIQVTVGRTTAVPPSPLLVPGTAYRFQPDGQQFALPVELTLRYDPSQKPAGVQDDELRLSRVTGGGWQEVAGSATSIGVVTASVTSFSTLGIVAVPVDEVTVQPQNTTISVGGMTQLSAAVVDVDGNELEQRAVVWSTSHVWIATVSETGVVTGAGEGTAEIAAVSEGHADTSTVTVVGEPQDTDDPVPIMDMGSAITYLGFAGGLYPGGANDPPQEHAAAQPALNTAQPFVFLSIGMSNTGIEFAAFIEKTATMTDLHPNLRMVNGGQSSRDAGEWADASSGAWEVVNDRLQKAGFGPADVQVAWVKLANAGPSVSLPSQMADAFVLRDQLRQIVGMAKDRFPNLTQVYFSSRIWSCAPPGTLNPEPFAYESGFSVKWLIEESISGDIAAPWLAWGAYLWADGSNPRSDGLTWEIDDLANDCTHPSAQGAQKVADLLLDFFRNSPLTTPWFIQSQSAGSETATEGVNLLALQLLEGRRFPERLEVEATSAGH